MKDNKAIIIGLLLLIAIAALIIWRTNSHTRSWQEHYTESKKDPYTLFLTAKVLKDYYPDHKFYFVKKNFSKTLAKHDYASGNYLFFGEQFYISKEGADSLLAFVEKGNNAFIATKHLPYQLLFKLFPGQQFCESKDYDGEEAIFDSITNVNLIHPNLKLDGGLYVKLLSKLNAKYHRWNFIPTQYTCKDGIHPTGLLNDQFVNFGFIPYGKGRVYFHTNPIVFTNFFMIRDEGKAYFDGIMAHMADDNIYYDVAARTPIVDFKNPQRRRQNAPNFGQEGPLTYILSQRSLAIAWYLLFSMGIFFLVFRSKRKQRIIPIVDKNENTSLIFIQNISNLYFQQGNNKQLSLQKFTYFQDFIRTKYGLNLKKDADHFAERLAQKSGIDITKINEILTLYNNITNSTFLSDNTLTKFHMAINHFYQNCK